MGVPRAPPRLARVGRPDWGELPAAVACSAASGVWGFAGWALGGFFCGWHSSVVTPVLKTSIHFAAAADRVHPHVLGIFPVRPRKKPHAALPPLTTKQRCRISGVPGCSSKRPFMDVTVTLMRSPGCATAERSGAKGVQCIGSWDSGRRNFGLSTVIHTLRESEGRSAATGQGRGANRPAGLGAE